MIEGENLADQGQYQRMVGKLIYVSHTTTIMRILRYVKGTSSKGILFLKNDHLDLLAYTDADWAEDQDGRRSTSRYFTLVGGSLVT